MKDIHRYIESFKEYNQPIWVFKNQEIFYKNLEEYRNEISSILAYISQKKRIAVYMSNPLTLVKILVLLQGAASDVLLISWGTDWELIKDFISRSETNLIVTDVEIENPIVETINIMKGDGTHHKADTFDDTIETNWIIPTSGTTNIPKLVPHTLSSLTRTVKRNTEIGSRMTWGLLYEVTRFAGLQVFLQSLFGGSSLILTDNNLNLEERLSDLVESGVNALSATPTMWRKILMTSQPKKMELRQITLGGEIVDDMILKALHNHFPQARITHIYASTEAGVGFAVNDGKAGFPASFIDKAPKDLQIKIHEDGMMYLKSAERKGVRYLGSSELLVQEDGFVKTGDLVEKKDDRYYFLGRENGAINIGGNKVIPEEVEQVILRFPDVKFVKIGSKKSAITGELVTATVDTCHPIIDQKQFKKELTEFCGQYLEKFKIPALIKIEDFLQTNPSGKMKRDKI